MGKIVFLGLLMLTFLIGGTYTSKNGAGDTFVNQDKPVYPITINLNSNWQFYRADSGKQTDSVDQLQSVLWQAASLPHSARVEPRVVNNQWQGDAFYRKTIVAQPTWKNKKIFIRFEGAMNKADVWLNGQHLMTHQGGYLPFVIDLSDELSIELPNRLMIKLDNRDNSVTGPKPLAALDFNMYGGLYRDVNLLVKNPLYITDPMFANQVAGGGIFVSYPEVSTEQARVSVQTHIANDSEFAKVFTVKQSILFAGKLIVESETQAINLEPDANLHKVQQLKVDKPKLWAPKSPHLYQLLTTINANGLVLDSQQTQIGIRRFKFVDNRLAINGKQQFLRGVNRHQEYPHVGYALSPQADYRDAKLIKEAGFDYVRLSHYPHSPAFMKAADELGLVLLDAILGWQYYNPDPAFQAHIFQTCRDLIRRDRNHPQRDSLGMFVKRKLYAAVFC